jgi:hypothetical protein
MVGRCGKMWAAALVWAAATMPAWAGDPNEGGHKHRCPPPSYTPLHYWLPTAYRLHEIHRPWQYTYPVDQFPMVPLHFESTRYPCPPVPPAVFTANYPWYPQPPGSRVPQEAAGAFLAPPEQLFMPAPGTGREPELIPPPAAPKAPTKG